MRLPVQACRLAGALLCLLALSPSKVIGQAVPEQGEQSSESVDEKLTRAQKLAEQRQYDQARRLFEETAALAREKGDPLRESRALEGIGRLVRGGPKPTEAQKFFERALILAEAAGVKEAVARLANSLGTLLDGQGRYKEAESWYERSLGAAEQAGSLPLKARALLNLSPFKKDDSNWESHFPEVAKIAKRLQDKELEGDAYHRWGDRLFARGDYAAAIEKLARAASLYREIRDLDDLALVYTSMGRLNRVHGRAAEAIPFYRNALQIQERAGDKVGVIQSLSAMGVAYAILGNMKKTRECYERAYTLGLETGSPRVIDFAGANLAAFLSERGDADRAAKILERVLQAGVDAYPGLRHSQLSLAYQKLGRLADSRKEAELAVALTPQAGDQRIKVLLRRAGIRERQGELTGAEADALDAIRSLEEIRSKLVPLDYMKQGFSAFHQEAYSMLIRLHYRRHEPEKGLEVSELARARAFLDLMATREVRLKSADEAEVAVLRSAEKKAREQGIAARQTGTNPELLSLAVARPGNTAEIVAAAVRLRSVLLCYWVTPETIFIWVVHPSGNLDFHRVEVNEKHLAALVSAVGMIPDPGKPTASNGARSTLANWQELYRLLILPVRKCLPALGTRLTVVPHGSLMRLPFGALADENGRYLLEDYPIHYIPAAALLQFTAGKKPRSDVGRRFLLVADPAFPKTGRASEAFLPLPGAREEIRSIARALPSGAATILEGEGAVEPAVGAAMSQASVLHIATHGIVRDDQPLDSYLALGFDPHTPADGRLTAAKIYGYDLHADLVTLSACRSGGGMLTGEGISALARAFFYAGTPSLIVSLWDVADQTANRLFPDFYRRWIGGRARIEALREAQLSLLADLRAGRVQFETPAGTFKLPEHPILWAGFVLLGEP